jgi:hypothetical protein
MRCLDVHVVGDHEVVEFDKHHYVALERVLIMAWLWQVKRRADRAIIFSFFRGRYYMARVAVRGLHFTDLSMDRQPGLRY